MQSEVINELATALSKAQGEIKAAAKDGNNPHFKSAYATLASVWEACREALTKNGLSVVQTFEHPPEGFDVCIKTTLLHASGQWISSVLPLKGQRQDAQACGSLATYARRYSLSAIVGVAPDDDDDGESAVDRSAPSGKPQRKPTASSNKPSPQAPAIEAVQPISTDTRQKCLVLANQIIGLIKDNKLSESDWKTYGGLDGIKATAEKGDLVALQQCHARLSDYVAIRQKEMAEAS